MLTLYISRYQMGSVGFRKLAMRALRFAKTANSNSKARSACHLEQRWRNSTRRFNIFIELNNTQPRSIGVLM